MKKLPHLSVIACVLVAMTFSACDTPSQGAKTGAIAGAVAGAIIGGDVRSAAIGAGAGAGAGALVGAARREDRRRQYPGYYEDRAHGSGYAEEIPVARRTGTPGYVISPYRPYATVDVRGVRRGAQVIDPASNRVFINP